MSDRGGRPLILIVDDHLDSRELLATVLHQAGMAVAEAGTGRDATARLACPPIPDLVLVDLSLPDCHGTEIVRRVKSDPLTANVPVVVLTASVRATDRQAAAQAGSAAFVEKPILPDDLLSVVRRLLPGAGAR